MEDTDNKNMGFAGSKAHLRAIAVILAIGLALVLLEEFFSKVPTP